MSLEKLIRVNSGFKCNFCETNIHTEKGLKRHMKLWHGFQCDFCEICFDWFTDDGYTCTICEYPLFNTNQYEKLMI